MKILIIGNGFDLAHGLPTKYTDFLKICSIAKTAKVCYLRNWTKLRNMMVFGHVHPYNVKREGNSAYENFEFWLLQY